MNNFLNLENLRSSQGICINENTNKQWTVLRIISNSGDINKNGYSEPDTYLTVLGFI